MLFADGPVEVEHQCGAGLMWHGIGYSKTEISHSDSSTEGESGKEVALIGGHVGACLVIIADSDIEFLRGGVLQTEHKMTEQVREEIRFFLLLLFRVIFVV